MCTPFQIISPIIVMILIFMVHTRIVVWIFMKSCADKAMCCDKTPAIFFV